MRFCAISLVMVVFAAPVSAGDLVYTPVNPSFGGNPFNSSHLLGIASAQRDATASDAGRDEQNGAVDSAGESSAELFARQLESRLLSALAGEVTDAIFGDNPQDSGIVTFGDTEVSFERGADSIKLTLTNFTDGSITVIEVPQLVVN